MYCRIWGVPDVGLPWKEPCASRENSWDSSKHDVVVDDHLLPPSQAAYTRYCKSAALYESHFPAESKCDGQKMLELEKTIG